MMMEAPQTDNFQLMEKSMALFIGTVIGDKVFTNPTTLSAIDTATRIPETVYTQTQVPPTGKLKNAEEVVYQLNAGTWQTNNISQKVQTHFIKFTIPPMYAKTRTDQCAYCDAPGLAIISQIDVRIGSYTSESLKDETIKLAVQKMTGKSYEKYANEHLGGIDGPLQKMEYAEHFVDQGSVIGASQRQDQINVIKPAIEVLLPVPIHLLRNWESFMPRSCLTEPITIAIFAKKMIYIMDFSRSFMPEDPSLDIKIFNRVICTQADLGMMDRCPPSSEKYLVPDSTYINTYKKFSHGDTKVSLRKEPTSEIWVMYIDTTMNMGSLYLANRSEKARERFWESCIKVGRNSLGTEVSSIVSAVELNTQLFADDGTGKRSRNWLSYSITDEGAREFTLKYNMVGLPSTTTTIRSTINLDIIPPNIYLDLSTWKTTNNSLGFLSIQHFKSVLLRIVEYDQYDPKHVSTSDLQISLDEQKVSFVPRGVFKFVGTNMKSYVFEGCCECVKADQISQFTYDVLAAVKIDVDPENIKANASIFTSPNFVKLFRPYWSWYDLDKKHPIKIESYTFEDSVSSAPVLRSKSEICLDRSPLDKFGNKGSETYDNYQIYINYGLTINGKNSNGFSIIGYRSPKLISADMDPKQYMQFIGNPVSMASFKPQGFLAALVIQNIIRVIDYNNSFKRIESGDMIDYADQFSSKIGRQIQAAGGGGGSANSQQLSIKYNNTAPQTHSQQHQIQPHQPGSGPWLERRRKNERTFDSAAIFQNQAEMDGQCEEGPVERLHENCDLEYIDLVPVKRIQPRVCTTERKRQCFNVDESIGSEPIYEQAPNYLNTQKRMRPSAVGEGYLRGGVPRNYELNHRFGRNVIPQPATLYPQVVSNNDYSGGQSSFTQNNNVNRMWRRPTMMAQPPPSRRFF